ncbi:MAG: hypothetical protein CMF90_08310 [Candidatus Marinimicrobia bacterium]|nr:hypothetical protein [Candidatus Neomarinimicrobiota bacterium]
MRGSIEMNTLKQIATKAMVFVFALSVLVPAVMTVGDNNVVEAEKLATVYLTNKGTAKTTESSPPTARANPSSRSTVSTLYATMTDVDTANATQNSHIVNANKIVITVVEPDFNTKVAVVSGENNFAAAAVDANDTVVIQGSAGNPVIDTDSDGDLTDEVYFAQYPDATDTTAVTFSGNSLDNGANKTALVVQAVSVANGASATTTAKPMITGIVTTAAVEGDDTHDILVGYYTSAVNTFRVKAWSTVQLEANGSLISVVETGRNTGVFEAEFIVADTEGVNDGAGVVATTAGTTDNAANDAVSDAMCGTSGVTAASGTTAAIDGRFDRSGGIYADCEMVVGNFDRAGATAQGASVALTLGTLPVGQNIADADGDGILYDEIYFLSQGTEGIAAANVGPSVDGNLEGTAITCGGDVVSCTDGTGGSVVLTVTVDGAAIADNTSDKGGYGIPVVNNVVDVAKVDTNGAGGVTSADLRSGRPGSDSDSAAGGIVTGTGSIKTSVFITGIDRTPVVEAQANSTITVQYQDLTDNNSATAAATGTKVKATAKIDVDAPTPVVTSPANGSSFKDRQPSFAGSVTDIGSGLDVSTIALYVDVLDDGADAAVALQAITLGNSEAWLGGAKSIDLQDDYRQTIATLDNTTTMTDGVTSATWTVTTSTNIPCLTVNDDGSAPNSEGGASHTNFANVATTCASAKSEPDVSLDYFSSATDLAGNRGFSDAKTTDTDDGPAFKDNYSFNIDELKPSLDSANTETGVYWNAATTAEKTGDATKIVVAFDDEISEAPASSFEITTDAGTVLTPVSTEIGTKGTTAAGVAYDKRKDVYLTLGTALATSETPKVKLVGNITDLAGNSNKSGNVANAADRIKPTLTLALSGGSGTGASPDDSVGLTKKAMTFTITTSEVLSTPPTISIFSEDYGTGGTYEEIVDNLDLTELGAGAANAEAFSIAAHTVIDTDKDGSLVDEIVISAATASTTPASQLVNLAINSVVNSSEAVIVTLQNNNSVALTNGADQIKISGNNNSAYNDASNQTSAEGTVAAVAVDATSYTATFDGSAAGFSDAAAKDSKAVVISATDVNSNTGTIGTRDQAASSGLYKFRLDKTAPVLNNDPDGDGTVGSSTTLPRPYVILEFTDNSKVTVVSASFGGDDVLAKLATTNSKKYFMVPEADLAAKTYAVKGKGTDLAGNKGAEGSYNMKVSTRKDYKATILAGWNLMSFPSDPVNGDISSVFSNSGIDQVVAYDAMSKGSPWSVATKDSSTQIFSGDLSNISSGNGYWVHSDEFSTQTVALVGPEGPSASAPPSIEAISLASGWNLIGIVDSTKALTQANEGTTYKTVANYLGTGGGSSVTKAFKYDTTGLSWSAQALDSGNVSIGEAYWVFAKPDANGMLTPIVP